MKLEGVRGENAGPSRRLPEAPTPNRCGIPLAFRCLVIGDPPIVADLETDRYPPALVLGYIWGISVPNQNLHRWQFKTGGHVVTS